MSKEIVKQNPKPTQLEKNIADNVLNRISILEKQGGINLPPNYSAANALKSAWLIIQQTKNKDSKVALEVCTKESIGNSLLDMVIQGLSPAKKQCYFIVRGNQLCMDRSYFGTVTVCKRLSNVHDAFARAVFEDDEFEYHVDTTTLDIVIDKHVPSLETIDPDKVKAAYSVVVRSDGTLYIEIMNSEQIKRAWNQGAMKGQSGAHKNFAEEMSKKTVLNRGCKLFINSSSDSDLLIDSINRTTELEYLPEPAEEIPEPKSISEGNKPEPIKDADESASDPRYSDPQFFIDTFESCTTVKECDDFAKAQDENIRKFNNDTINKINKAYLARCKELKGK